MTKERYKWLLLQPEWIEKKEKILKRDKHRCQKCLSRDYLHVHHIWYIEGRLPWEVPDIYLITLCESCHKKEHKNKPITDFIKKTKIKKKPKLTAPKRNVNKAIRKK